MKEPTSKETTTNIVSDKEILASSTERYSVKK